MSSKLLVHPGLCLLPSSPLPHPGFAAARQATRAQACSARPYCRGGSWAKSPERLCFSAHVCEVVEGGKVLRQLYTSSGATLYGDFAGTALASCMMLLKGCAGSGSLPKRHTTCKYSGDHVLNARTRFGARVARAYQHEHSDAVGVRCDEVQAPVLERDDTLQGMGGEASEVEKHERQCKKV